MTFVRDDLRPLHRRTAVLLLVCVGVFALLLGRLWLLQVVQLEKWETLAENNRLRRLPLEAARGTVTDIHGNVLVGNRPAFRLLLFPEEIADPDATAAFLAHTGIADTRDVRARIDRALETSHLPSVIADNLTWAQVTSIAAHRADFPELEVHQTIRRSVPDESTVAHVVGQLGEVGPAQLRADPDLRPGQLVGRSGIEQAYEHELGGTMGNLVMVVDALGRQVSELAEEAPVPGQPLQVTIDLRLQREAAAAMAGRVGAVVGLDPRNGEIRVLLSQPSFDPEIFAGFVDPARWKALLADPLRPLTDRAIQALYPPGSTIKPIYAAGALEDGLRTPRASTYCRGGVTLYGHPYRCWKGGGHGAVGLEEAIEVSCDTYFYLLARDAGLDRLGAWARAVGLGTSTGIELEGEASGLVPDEAWSERVRGHSWFAGETISVGIGQGPILATPLQLAVAYAALVNGGYRVEPHLVAARQVERRPIGYDAAILNRVRRGMERVVSGTSGTARSLADLAVDVAGKTGTAQVVRKKEGVRWQDLPWEQRHHALFVGYAPADDPRLVIAVVVEHGGDASTVAAPIAGRILEKAFGPDTPVAHGDDVLRASTTPASDDSGVPPAGASGDDAAATSGAR